MYALNKGKSMEPIDCIILGVLAVAVVVIVVNLVKRKKEGKSGCGCGCAGCPSAGACPSAKNNTKEEEE